MIISLDTETTGTDFAHGAMPFLVTTCADDGVIRFWEWDVDPLTRRPEIPTADIADIADLMDASELIYLQNAKFDARALLAIGLELPWTKVRDTLVMGHLLASNHRHDLTSMCIEYLGVDIEPFEVAIKEVTRACRAAVKRDYPLWRIAVEGADNMPSVKGSSKRDDDKPWKNDMWLSRVFDKQSTTCSQYANTDSEYTLYLGLEMERLISERGLWAIYEHRMQLPRIACEMEEYGVTVIGVYTEATICDYDQYIAEVENELVTIAAEYNHELELASGAAINDNMRDFFYGAVKQECPRCGYGKRIKHWNGERTDDSVTCPKCAKSSRRQAGVSQLLTTTRCPNLDLPVVVGKKSGNASLDKDVMQEYLATLDGSALDFVRMLADKRKCDTDLSYMESYRRFWVPIGGLTGYYRIHPSFNPFGTDHLRWSSNSPNLQNVAKQEDKRRVSVRNCFGPAPGREWWSMDFQNIELRIPAYESGEGAMVELFERPNDPPYFGSYHCLNASIVYPDLFHREVCPKCLDVVGDECQQTCLLKVPLSQIDGGFKKKYKSAEYQWCKNGGFALQYGCGERKADATFRRRGAYRKLKEKLPKVAALNYQYIKIAEHMGYVETLPDIAVDPTRGYPILASRTDDGRVLSTTPFNYHISGTACWCKNTALVRCAAQLEVWRKGEGFDGHLSLEIHDELLFDFPRGEVPEENLPRVLVLKKLMEMSGETLIPRIPTPVSVEYHDESWAKVRAM